MLLLLLTLRYQVVTTLTHILWQEATLPYTLRQKVTFT